MVHMNLIGWRSWKYKCKLSYCVPNSAPQSWQVLHITNSYWLPRSARVT